ncbi:PseudoU_synth_2 domain-containing protein [Psidium guajava]|nr:PseudoU_synth_2 domain-containing protein [Psidium guajava]
MAKNPRSPGSAALLLPLLLLGSVIFKIQAIRPLGGAELSRSLVSMDRLSKKKSSFGMTIRESGPSPDGPGHRYEAQWLAGRSDENHPSPDVIHNELTVSESGPSSDGLEHRYKAQRLTGRSEENHLSPNMIHKDLAVSESGPSPEGPGHGYKAQQLTGQSDENRPSPNVTHKELRPTIP